MPLAVLQPCAAKVSLEHYRDTIESPVNLATISDLLTARDRDALLAAHPNGTVPLWGAKPGETSQHVAKWERITPGDHVLFAGKGQLFADATVTHVFRNPTLAKRLWGSSPTRNGLDQTWELMFALEPPSGISVPYAELNTLIGRQPGATVQEFNVLDDAQSSALLTRVLPGQPPPPRSRDESVEGADVGTDVSDDAAGVDDTDTGIGEEPPAAEIELVHSEQNTVTEFETLPRAGSIAIREEAKLVSHFETSLVRQGHEVRRVRIRVPGERHSLVTDTYDVTTGTLYEAKSGTDRATVRLGIGQLFDYLRFMPQATTGALLLPAEPSADIKQLIKHCGLQLVYQQLGSWMRSRD